MKTKDVDCLEIKRQGAAEVQQRLQGMSEKEQLEYWQKRTAELRAKQKSLKKK